jgi:hypothetical protein
MSVFDEEETPAPRSRGPMLVVALLVLAAVAAGAWWLMQPAPPPEPAPAAKARPRTPEARPPAASTRKPAATDTAPAERPSAERAPAAEAPAARSTGVLRVRSDVPGAAVFIDRKFLGNTPLEIDGLDPGSHQLRVSVEGYEGHAQAVEIGDTPAEIEVRFKEVRLDAAIAVVHKHGVGSCSGRLIADTSGLRYDTAKADDAFRIPFAELEAFSVDYLKKSLRVKKRGGRTWNFEDPAGKPDPLFVFHRDVEKARTRLAGR